jgi:acetyl esterase/lipase
LEPDDSPEVAILHLHGGGYTIGSLATIRPLASHMARAAGAKVLTVAYRLAPEHPHPGALDDAVSAYEWLLKQGWPPERLALAGDSAGGGLAVAALVALRRRGLPQPAAGVFLSPWTDLALTGASWGTNEGKDPLVTRWLLADMAERYLAGADPRLPTASPLYADLAGLPPLLIQVGTAEVLLDDSVALARAARAAGVAVTLECWSDMIHVWQAFAPVLDEANAAITRIGAWLNDRWTATAQA